MINNKLGAVILGGVILGILPGCATVTSGSSQVITVNTMPQEAICKLEREGEDIGSVNPTPGKVMVGKDKDPISVVCRKAGYQNNNEVMESSFQAMTLGNILIGGVIGVAIDAGSGAMHHYPSMVSITLVPEEFESTAQRDSYFTEARNEIGAEFDESKQFINETCPENGCEEQLKKAEEAKNAKLVKLETQVYLAKIGDNAPISQSEEQPVGDNGPISQLGEQSDATVIE